MIELSTGEIWLLDNKARLRPRMALSEFRGTVLFGLAHENMTIDERFERQYVFGPVECGDAYFVFCLFFAPDKLKTVHMMLTRHKPAHGWFRKLMRRLGSVEAISALETKALNDRWLECNLGQQCSIKHYPPWGEIRSEYDQLRDGAWIAIEYT